MARTPVRHETNEITVQNLRLTALALATTAFTVNFWACALISPLAPTYKALLDRSPVSVSVLVAVPVIVGSVGRIALGALTDRYGGRTMFTAACLIGAVPAGVTHAEDAERQPTPLCRKPRVDERNADRNVAPVTPSANPSITESDSCPLWPRDISSIDEYSHSTAPAPAPAPGWVQVLQGWSRDDVRR